MKRTAGEMGLAARNCICDPMDLAALGHMTNCPANVAPPARRGDWIQTFTGRQYWPLDPRADEVEIQDIAHAPAMLCRYTGHCERFYSVAEHSVHVSHVVEQALMLQCGEPARIKPLVLVALLHDAAEAYCNDIARPVKRSIEGYAEIEGVNECAIFERFGLPDIAPYLVRLLKQADNAMLLAEQAVLMKPPPAPWAPVDVPLDMLRAAHGRMARACHYFEQPGYAKHEFLARFAELTP